MARAPHRVMRGSFWDAHFSLGGFPPYPARAGVQPSPGYPATPYAFPPLRPVRCAPLRLSAPQADLLRTEVAAGDGRPTHRRQEGGQGVEPAAASLRSEQPEPTQNGDVPCQIQCAVNKGSELFLGQFQLLPDAVLHWQIT